MHGGRHKGRLRRQGRRVDWCGSNSSCQPSVTTPKSDPQRRRVRRDFLFTRFSSKNSAHSASSAVKSLSLTTKNCQLSAVVTTPKSGPQRRRVRRDFFPLDFPQKTRRTRRPRR
jgi:hypothetical protein